MSNAGMVCATARQSGLGGGQVCVMGRVSATLVGEGGGHGCGPLLPGEVELIAVWLMVVLELGSTPGLEWLEYTVWSRGGRPVCRGTSAAVIE